MSAAGPAPDERSDGPFRNEADAIQRVLVRMLPAGQVRVCGTVHPIAVRRGQQVVVDDGCGCWLACVLENNLETAGVPIKPPGATGELLRVATADDLESAAKVARRSPVLFKDVEQLLASEQSKRGFRPAVTVVATEQDLTEAYVVLRCLGVADESLGPLAVRLANTWGVDRVQWLPVRVEPDDGPGPVEGTGGADARQDDRFWQRFSAVTDHQVAAGEALGREHQLSAGNRGMYQQKRRRDPPANRSVPPGRSWMIRIRTAAGGLAAGQLLRLLELAQDFGDGTLRLTMRQAIQLHGVSATAPQTVMNAIHNCLLQTAGACGNTVRNVTCCPLPTGNDPFGADAWVRRLASQLATTLLPQGPAFQFRFTEEPQQNGSGRMDQTRGRWTAGNLSHLATGAAGDRWEVLPHKWKIGVASTAHDCCSVRSNDLAMIVRADDPLASAGERPVDIYLGGSLAYRTGEPDSFPMLGKWFGTIDAKHAGLVAGRLIKMFAVRGQPLLTGKHRHRSRFKYVVARTPMDLLLDQFNQDATVAGCVDRGQAPGELTATTTHPACGVMATGQRWQRVAVERGRLTTEHRPLLQEWHSSGAVIRVGSHHDLIVSFPPGKHGQMQLPVVPAAVAFQACPALPTCSQALAEAETQWEAWLQAVCQAATAARIPPPQLAVSGCTNGCARSLLVPVGLVAESPTRFAVYLGGGAAHLGTKYGSVESPMELRRILEGLFQQFRRDNALGLDFSSWWRASQEPPSSLPSRDP